MRWTIPGYEKQKAAERESHESDVYLLLLSLVPLIIIGPAIPPGEGSGLLLSLLLTFFMGGSLPSLRGDRKRFLTGFMTVLIALELFWMAAFSGSLFLFVLGEVVYLIFVLVLTVHLISRLVRMSPGLDRILPVVIALVFTSGFCLGTALHLTSLLGFYPAGDLFVLTGSFTRYLLTGVMGMTPGGLPGFQDTDLAGPPLTKVIWTIGSVAGYAFILLAIWKITGREKRSE